MLACYCRISSHDQKPDSQKAEMQRWLKGNKIRSKDVLWFEDIESGATRPYTNIRVTRGKVAVPILEPHVLASVR